MNFPFTFRPGELSAAYQGWELGQVQRRRGAMHNGAGCGSRPCWRARRLKGWLTPMPALAFLASGIAEIGVPKRPFRRWLALLCERRSESKGCCLTSPGHADPFKQNGLRQHCRSPYSLPASLRHFFANYGNRFSFQYSQGLCARLACMHRIAGGMSRGCEPVSAPTSVHFRSSSARYSVSPR